MNSGSLIKKVLVLVFLLIILIAVFVIQGNEFGSGYFSWLKMKLVGMGPELNLAEEDSGLDLTDINIENASVLERSEIEKETEEEPEVVIEPADTEGSGVAKEEPLGSMAVIPETSGPSMDEVLLEIEQEINQIAKEIKKIDIEIRGLIEVTI